MRAEPARIDRAAAGRSGAPPIRRRVVDRQKRGHLRLAIGPGPEGRPEPRLQPDRAAAPAAARLVVAIGNVEPCAAREDRTAPVASRIRNPTARSSRKTSSPESSPVSRHPRAVVEAGRALERRDEGQLDGLGRSRDEHLADRNGGDPRGRDAADPAGGTVAAEPFHEKNEAGHDPTDEDEQEAHVGRVGTRPDHDPGTPAHVQPWADHGHSRPSVIWLDTLRCRDGNGTGLC